MKKKMNFFLSQGINEMPKRIDTCVTKSIGP